MNKSLICEIAIAHNYGERESEKKFQEAHNKTNFERYSLYSLGFFSCWPIATRKKIHTLKNNYGQKSIILGHGGKKSGNRIEIHSKIAIIIRFRIAMSSFSCYFIIFSAAWIFHHFFSALNRKIAFNAALPVFVHHKLRYNYILLLQWSLEYASFSLVVFFLLHSPNLILNIRFNSGREKTTKHLFPLVWLFLQLHSCSFSVFSLLYLS